MRTGGVCDCVVMRGVSFVGMKTMFLAVRRVVTEIFERRIDTRSEIYCRINLSLVSKESRISQTRRNSSRISVNCDPSRQRFRIARVITIATTIVNNNGANATTLRDEHQNSRLPAWDYRPSSSPKYATTGNRTNHKVTSGISGFYVVKF
jgi:hypothetical protein